MTGHGGRFQAQGDDIDERVKGGVSASWDQHDPATKGQGVSLLVDLQGACTRRERQDREEAFGEARSWVAKVDWDVQIVGHPFIKSCYNYQLIRQKVRVDLEIKRGRAWVTDADR